MFISGAYENTIVQLVKLFKTLQVSQFLYRYSIAYEYDAFECI